MYTRVIMRLTVVYLMFHLGFIVAKPLSRGRRFLTPAMNTAPFLTQTAYPVPTINPVLSLLASGNLNCPHKRSADTARVPLDDRTLQNVYLSLLGSDYDRRFMAATPEDAARTFVHLLPSGDTKQETNEDKEGILKSKIIKDLDQLFPWITSILQAANVTFDEINNVNVSNGTKFRHVGDILDRLLLSTKDLQTLIDVDTDLNVLRQLRLEDIAERRVRRQAGGSTSNVEYCHARGYPTGNGYLHMCTTCSLTTTFSADRFPRLINEATCDLNDCNCFTVRGTSHGKCAPTYHMVKMLRRSSKGCMMVFQNGQQIITDKWELYDQQIRLGCECVFNKNSMYAQFIPGTTT